MTSPIASYRSLRVGRTISDGDLSRPIHPSRCPTSAECMQGVHSFDPDSPRVTLRGKAALELHVRARVERLVTSLAGGQSDARLDAWEPICLHLLRHATPTCMSATIGLKNPPLTTSAAMPSERSPIAT